MLRARSVLFAAAAVFLAIPGLGWAQSTTSGAIAGVVKDTTGAVLPGVTVEAASPALIEKMVSVVSDEAGNYKIVNLRPGTYTVTFTLPGFSTVKREGVEVNLGVIVNVSGELKVGSLQETVTVTGASPVVDVQNVRTQQTITQEQLAAIPTARSYVGMVAITLGASGGGGYTGTAGSRDVGGNNGEGVTSMSIHGSRSDGGLNIEGMRANSLTGGGFNRRFMQNQDAVQESVSETSAQSAETETGGVSTNMIIREGGNDFHGLAEGEYTGLNLASWMQSKNISQELRDRGLKGNGNRERKIYSVGGGFGGPIRRDKTWFYVSPRTWGTQEEQAGIFYNKPQYQHTIYYEADTTNPAFTDTYVKDITGRLTHQLAAKQKLSAVVEVQKLCSCHNGLSVLNSAERAPNPLIGPGFLSQVNWSNPRTNRLLFEAGFATRIGKVDNKPQDEVAGNNPNASGLNPLKSDISVQFGGTLGYGPSAAVPGAGGPYGLVGTSKQYNTMFSVSYVTGSHAFKFGEQSISGKNPNNGSLLFNDFPFQYTTTGGTTPGLLRPTSITAWISPANYYTNVKYNLGTFAQDQWTMKRVTMNLGVRMDMLNAFSPASTRPASVYFPELKFDKAPNLPNWKDVSPRLGAAWDVFGNGKTAVKGAWGRYVTSEATTIAQARNPQAGLTSNASRTWTDANNNLIPDCDLKLATANGECGAYTSTTFGTSVLATNYDTKLTDGFGKRPFSYQTSATVAQDLGHGMAVIAGYFRTTYGNITVTQSLAVPSIGGVSRGTPITPADFTQYCVKTPSDARLGAFGGQIVCAYDINFSTLTTNSLIQRDSDLALTNGRTNGRSEVFNGFDVALRARFGNGGLLNGGVSVGKTSLNNCTIVDSPSAGSAQTAQIVASPAFCATENRQDQVKLNASYPIKWGIQAAAVYQNIPGTNQAATLTLTSAQLRAAVTAADPNLISTTTALGRNVSSPAGFVSLGIIPANVMREKRGQQLDLRFSKTFRFNGKTLRPGFDIYNVTNSNDVLAVQTAYTPSATTPGGAWLTPSSVLPGRLYKFNATFNF